MNSFLAGAVLFALAPDPTQSTHPLLPAAALAQSTSERPDSAQRGSTPTPSEVNGAADTSQRGSRGSTAGGGERTGPPAAGIERERARARANSQARRRNRKGSLERPADSPPQRNEHPKAMGSGAPMTPVDQQPRPEGRNYVEGAQTRPDKQPSSSPPRNEQQR